VGVPFGQPHLVKTKMVVALVVAPSHDVASGIARTLVEERLCACVNLMPVQSVYEWQGTLQDGAEVLMVAKLPAAGFERFRLRVAGLHPYEVPEILALEVKAAHAPYAAWVTAQTPSTARAARPKKRSARR
jgi:periplasmic divalent cation tolerance protein